MTTFKSITFLTCFYVISSIILTPTQSAHAATLFKLDFETGLPSPLDTPNPVWALPPDTTNTFGDGNFFELISNIAHSGNACLRFNPNGRNGFCNTCGLKSVIQDTTGTELGYFIADSGEDLTLSANKGPAAQPGRILYNKSNGFSKWEVLSVANENAVNDKLTVKLLRSGLNGETNGFNDGDQIFIARQCGIDGIFAGNINRRSDCNIVIHPFKNVAGTQTGGQSIFRRFYMRMDMVKPGSQKLRYWSNNIDSSGSGNRTGLFLDAKGAADKPPIFPLINAVRLTSDTSNDTFKPGSGISNGLVFERGKWYYIEEEFKPESAPAAGDGEYRLWFSESGKENTDGSIPILTLTGLFLPVADYVTFWGNFQHNSHTIGQVYLDDIEIATDIKIGGKSSDHTSISPPHPPGNVQ